MSAPMVFCRDEEQPNLGAVIDPIKPTENAIRRVADP
jgi:hypothetical protein